MTHRIFILLLCTALCSCKGFDYTLSGESFLPGDSVHLTDAYAGGAPIASGIIAPDSSFRLHGRIAEPLIARLVITGEEFFDIPGIILEKGDTRIRFADGRPVLSGTPLNDSLEAMKVKQRELKAQLTQMFRDNTPFEQFRALSERAGKLEEQVVNKNRDNILGLYVFAIHESPQYGTDSTGIATVKARISQFPPAQQSHPILREILARITAQENTAVGKPYTDITLTDTAGIPVALSSVAGKGRWVLIDFWATWCVPCVNEIPHLQSVYREFRDKGLEIYAVSLDNDTAQWQAYVARHDMPWINVIGIDTDRKSPAAEAYAIRSIPSNLLLSPEGVIVARNLRAEGVPEGMTLRDELTKRLSAEEQCK